MAEDVAVAPIEIDHNVDTPKLDKPDLAHRLARTIDRAALCKTLFVRVEAGKKRTQIFFPDAAEQF